MIVGKALACGYTSEVSEYCSLPVHFNDTVLLNIMSEEVWVSIFPYWKSYGADFKLVICNWLAAVVYHSDWLRSTLSVNNSLFNNVLFAQPGLLKKLRAKLVHPNCEHSPIGMTVTGLTADMKSRLDVGKLINKSNVDNITRISTVEKQLQTGFGVIMEELKGIRNERHKHRKQHKQHKQHKRHRDNSPLTEIPSNTSNNAMTSVSVILILRKTMQLL